MTYSITIAHTTEALSALETEWKHLQAESDAWSVFSTWDWASVWWRHFGHKGELWLLQARDAHGLLVGIAPLMLTNYSRLPGMSWRQIQFISTDLHTDHLDFIIKRGLSAQIVPMFLDVLRAHQNRWDVLYLENIVETSPTLSALRATDISWQTEAEHHAPFATLDLDWETYFAERVGYRKRKNQRRAMRKLEQDFANRWTFDYVTQPAEIDSAFNTLVKLHQTRWDETIHPGAFGDGAKLAFFQDMARTFVHTDMLRLFRLCIDGQTAATFLAFQYGNRIFDYASGINRDFMAWNTGHVLNQLTLQYGIANGIQEYDFLLGDEEYKYEWGAVDRRDITLAWYATWRGRSQRALYEQLRESKSRLKSWIRYRRHSAPATVQPRSEGEREED